MSALPSHRYTGSYRTPTLEHATVAGVMRPGVITCSPGSTVTELARMMVTHHIHCIAVMGVTPAEDGEHLVWSIVSDVDLLQIADSEGLGQTAESVARRPIISVEPAMSLRDARKLMLANGASHVLVIEPRQQHPVGVLSTLDIIGVMAWGEG